MIIVPNRPFYDKSTMSMLTEKGENNKYGILPTYSKRWIYWNGSIHPEIQRVAHNKSALAVFFKTVSCNLYKLSIL